MGEVGERDSARGGSRAQRGEGRSGSGSGSGRGESDDREGEDGWAG